jgi:hypothetical protein
MKSINLIIKLDLQWIKNFFIISSTEVEVFEKSYLDISDNTWMNCVLLRQLFLLIFAKESEIINTFPISNLLKIKLN